MSTHFYTCAHCASPIKLSDRTCPGCGGRQGAGAARLPSAMALALGLTLVGCGDKDDEDSGTSDTGVTDTDTDTDIDTDTDETGGADYGTADTWGVEAEAQQDARRRLLDLDLISDAEVDASVED